MSSAATVAAAAWLAAGCGTYLPTPRYAQIYGGPVPLTMINTSAVSACYVRISPSNGRNEWGDDWLGPTEIVVAGASRTFYLAANAVWDLRVETCGRGVLAETHGLHLAAPAQFMLNNPVFSPVVMGSGGQVVLSPSVNASAQAVVNVAATPGDDVVTLRDGTLLRGRVAEMHPAQSVTLVLLTGETRRVEWSVLATAAGPSFPHNMLGGP